jgi:ribosomal protein S18 acetylase RimI-like enzyme
MSNSLSIRSATPDDADALARVHIDSWRAAYRGLMPDTYLDSLDYERRAGQFRKSLATQAEETYVVEEHGQTLGFLTVGVCRDEDVDTATTGEIWGIYLAPEHFRKGIGRQLASRGMEMLKSKGYKIAVLWVFAGNAQARGFYEAMGFMADGAERMLNPGMPLKAIRYRQSLTDVESLEM